MKLSKITAKKKINPKQVLNQKRSYYEEVSDQMSEKGVDFFAPSSFGGTLDIDKDYLHLPKNITEVSSKELGEYLNAFTQQKAYMRTLLGYSETMCEEMKRKYEQVSENKYRDLLRTKLSETAKEREVNSDPEVRPVYEKWCDYVNKARLLRYNIESIEDILFMISREVSRRTGDFNEETRNYNVQKQ